MVSTFSSQIRSPSLSLLSDELYDTSILFLSQKCLQLLTLDLPSALLMH